MCGRFGRDIPWDELREVFAPLVHPEAGPNLEPKWDIRPTSSQWIVRPCSGGNELVQARWGLIPYWHRQSLRDFRLTTFNARAETVASAPAFKDAFKRRRCLVPASCWYEWKGAKAPKTKFTFTPHEGGWMCFAGLWDRWRGDAGEIESFTIVTQPAGAPLNGCHDRAPVVVPRASWAQWLDAHADASPLLGPESVDLFNIQEVPPS